MLLLITGLLAFYTSPCPPLSAATIPTAAGVIAYAYVHGEVLILMADHTGNNRGWGTFGGRIERGETPAQAAAREFSEETRCAYDARLILQQILNRPRSVEDAFFRAYVVRVPYKPPEAIAMAGERTHCQGPSFDERGPYAWIPLHFILNARQRADGALFLPAGVLPQGSSPKLWEASARTIRAAYHAGLLPALAGGRRGNDSIRTPK